MDEIEKRCPFCGGECEYDEEMWCSGGGWTERYIKCQGRCGAKFDFGKEKEETIKEFNARHRLDGTIGRVLRSPIEPVHGGGGIRNTVFIQTDEENSFHKHQKVRIISE